MNKSEIAFPSYQIDSMPREENSVVGKIRAALRSIPERSAVTVEGPPIYVNVQWNIMHEFGYNALLSTAMLELEERACDVEHAALFDNYSIAIDRVLYEEEYKQLMRRPPSRIVKEHDLVPLAIKIMRKLQTKEKPLLGINNRIIHFTRNNGKLLSSALMDAAFQLTKKADYNVIIHPIEARSEQEDMRRILLALLNGKLPFGLINIYFKKNNSEIAKALLYDKTGIEHRIQLAQ